MLAWLKTVGYPVLWVAFVLLALLVYFVGSQATPHLDKELSFKLPPLMAFETAGDAAGAQKVLDESERADPKAKEKFKTALGWDFLFLFIYPLCGAVGCLLVIKFLETRNLPGVRIGRWLLAAQLLAVLIDLSENFVLLKLLDGPIENSWLRITNVLGILKWVIPGLTLLYLLFGGVMWLLKRKTSTRPEPQATD